MSILTLISKFFSRSNPDASLQFDPTQYKITTNTHEYTGRIIIQDDFSIKFRNEKNKNVRILKANINQMSIVNTGKQHNKARPKRR